MYYAKFIHCMNQTKCYKKTTKKEKPQKKKNHKKRKTTKKENTLLFNVHTLMHSLDYKRFKKLNDL